MLIFVFFIRLRRFVVGVEIELQRAHGRLEHSAGRGLDAVDKELRFYGHGKGRVEAAHVKGPLLVYQSAQGLLLGLQLLLLVLLDLIGEFKQLLPEAYLELDILIDLRTFFLQHFHQAFEQLLVLFNHFRAIFFVLFF